MQTADVRHVVAHAALGASVAAGGLALVGFSPLGPVAGSLAAIHQASCEGGMVAAGSAFAVAQSAAMTGAGAATGATIAAGVAVARRARL